MLSAHKDMVALHETKILWFEGLFAWELLKQCLGGVIDHSREYIKGSPQYRIVAVFILSVASILWGLAVLLVSLKLNLTPT